MSSPIEVVYADEDTANTRVATYVLGERKGHECDVLFYSSDIHQVAVDRLERGGVLVVDVITQHGLNFAERYREIFETARQHGGRIVVYTTSYGVLLKVLEVIPEARHFDLKNCCVVTKGNLDDLIAAVRGLVDGSVPDSIRRHDEIAVAQPA